MKANNGIGKKNYLFSPDGRYCYKINDELIGIAGYKGESSYSLKINQTLKCEGERKSGFIKSSENVCTHCNYINGGCHECYYKTKYPNNYLFLKRERRLVSNYYQEVYSLSNEGFCLNCNNDLSLENCDKYGIAQKKIIIIIIIFLFA